MLRLQAAKADAVLMVLYPKPAAVFLRDAHKLGYKPLAVGQTGFAIRWPSRSRSASRAPRHVRTISMVRYMPDDPEMEEWRKLFEQVPARPISVYNIFGIGSAQVLVEALKRGGPELTREKLIEAMASHQGLRHRHLPGLDHLLRATTNATRHRPGSPKEPGGATASSAVTRSDSKPLLLFGYLLVTGSPRARSTPSSPWAS